MQKATTVSREVLNAIVGHIVKHFHPQRVILFGSQARGDATESSDLDLCVVMDTQGKPSQEIARQIEQAIAPLAPTILWRDRPLRVPIQVHVFSPDEFEGALLWAQDTGVLL